MTGPWFLLGPRRDGGTGRVGLRLVSFGGLTGALRFFRHGWKTVKTVKTHGLEYAATKKARTRRRGDGRAGTNELAAEGWVEPRHLLSRMATA
jgi:hypothetical protein